MKTVYYDVPINGGKYKQLYGWWTRMRAHANPINPEDRAGWYQKKGITLCKEWYYDFAAFADYCYSIGYAPGDHIHLKEGCTEFGPGNIEFKDYRYCPRIKYAEFDGVTKSAYAWCKELGISYNTVVYYINHGKTAREAIEYVQSQTTASCTTGSANKCTAK